MAQAYADTLGMGKFFLAVAAVTSLAFSNGGTITMSDQIPTITLSPTPPTQGGRLTINRAAARSVSAADHKSPIAHTVESGAVPFAEGIATNPWLSDAEHWISVLHPTWERMVDRWSAAKEIAP